MTSAADDLGVGSTAADGGGSRSRPRSGGRRAGGARDADAPRYGSDLEAEEAARELALRQLGAAPRSRWQLEQAMAKKEIPPEVGARVLDRFTEVGLVDDAEYARMVVRTRHAERGLSRRAIAVELRRKGIDESTAGEALLQVDGDDEASAARELVRRKLTATAALAPDVRRRRIHAALGRRGYGPGLVAQVLREELAQEADGGGIGDDAPELGWVDDL